MVAFISSLNKYTTSPNKNHPNQIVTLCKPIIRGRNLPANEIENIAIISAKIIHLFQLPIPFKK